MEIDNIDNNYLFEELTQDFKYEMISNTTEVLTKIYFGHTLYFCNCLSSNNQRIEYSISKLFQENKLVTYEISKRNISNIKLFFSSKQDKLYENKQADSINIVFCIEKCCCILESIDEICLNSIINKENISFIDISKNKFSTKHTNKIAEEEVTNFCSYYQYIIENNFFIDLTIRPMICYLIRRFYYPSIFFKDPSFFNFDDHQKNEKEILSNLYSLCQSKNLEKLNQYEERITSIIPKEIQEKNQINEFKKIEFKKLRLIFSNANFSIYLVIHLPTLYLFAMKKTKNPNQNEIDFCSHHCHRCFMHFYGFYKNKGKTYFIYEFMSQGNLMNYILNFKNNINNLFKFNAIIRIYQGIKYLQSKRLIHRDLSPSNILIDHDYNIFISDFETIRKINTISNSNNKEYTQNIGTMIYSALEQNLGEEISFPVDIYSFGQIIYFIFERKHPIDSLSLVAILNNKMVEFLPEMKNCPNSFQNLYKKCIKNKVGERALVNDIEDTIVNETEIFYFFNNYFIKNDITKIDINELCNFFLELIYMKIISFHSNTLNLCIEQIFNFNSINVFSYNETFSDEYYLLTNFNNSLTLFNLGHIYENGINVKCDYKKAKFFYKFSSKFNNSNAFCALGNLYKNGFGVKQNYSKAKKYYELAAKQNNSNAFVEIGNLYANGLGVKTNYFTAQDFYELSAKQNNDKAFFNLGVLYVNGLGVKQNYEKGKYYYELAAKQQNSDAFLDLGIMYANGLGVEKNYKVAKEYYESAAKLNNSKALVALGILYAFGLGVNKDYHEAKRYYELSAKLNNSDALLDLGNIYAFGLGVEQDYGKAKEYYEKSALKNNSNAILALGNIYIFGLSVEQDYIKAKEYYELAAKNGNSCATLGLGILYDFGLGVTKDHMIAKKYYELSSIKSTNKCFHSLGDMYANSIGIDNEYSRSFQYCQLFTKQNKSDAYLYLGILYANGIGVEKDIVKSKEYYELAGKENNPIAYLFLGDLYYIGYSIEKDYKKAKEYFELAAKQNNSDALLNLGDLYLNGYGVEKDVNKAIEYFKLASEQNNSYALVNLGDIYFNGNGVAKDFKLSNYYYELAIKQNNSDAYIKMGYSYLNGLGVLKDILKAKYYYEKAAQQNNSDAYIFLGDYYSDNSNKEKDFKLAKTYYELAAKQNNYKAFKALGNMYLNGLWVEQDYSNALYYYELSAKQNDSDSLYILGNIYEKGLGINKDYLKARQYYELSSMQNNSKALLKLAYLYSSGKFIDHDKSIESLYLCRIINIDKKDINLSQQNKYNGIYYRAINDLGLINIKKNIEIAINYIKEAAYSEYPFAQNNFGLIYKFYLNDDEKALYMFGRSSEHNFSLAYFNIGYFYENKGEIEKSIEYYEKASINENEPLVFRNEQIDDERIKMSIKFIACITNLKLIEFFVSKNDIKKGKQYFIKLMNSLKYRPSNIDEKKLRSLSYLKHYILMNFNLNDNHISRHTNNINIQNCKENMIKNIESCSNLDNFILMKDKCNYNYIIKCNEMDLHSNCKIIKINQISFSEDPSKFFDFSINDKNLFIKFIHETVLEMEKIVLKPPYSIFFGRFDINEYKEQKHQPISNHSKKDIDKSFYDGFGF